MICKPKAWFVAIASITATAPVLAEILNSTTPQLRIRVGDNVNGSVNTVIYNAGIPAELDSLAGATGAPETISTNPISGGSGIYTVRYVTDVNARTHRNNAIATNVPLTGTFSFDSSAPLTCTTPASCGGNTIPFSKIKWNIRDNDTLNGANQYDGSANQVFQNQTDIDGAQNKKDTRHRNYYQYIYINDLLRPAGIYEGVVEINGVAN